MDEQLFKWNGSLHVR